MKVQLRISALSFVHLSLAVSQPLRNVLEKYKHALGKEYTSLAGKCGVPVQAVGLPTLHPSLQQNFEAGGGVGRAAKKPNYVNFDLKALFICFLAGCSFNLKSKIAQNYHIFQLIALKL